MNLWKRKLAAFLHDPPSKALDIPTHGERAAGAFRQAGFTDQEVGTYFRDADHTAAAADRLPFPESRASGLQCSFDGIRNSFVHPLGTPTGEPLRLPFHAEFKSVIEGIEGEQSIQPVLSDASLRKFTDDADLWRARFFAHWRLWPKHSAELDYRSALLPADTRIPDHSIWTHMQVVSALAGCAGDDQACRPAFLKIQLGPVQDFIAAARSIRDLWSGSYLLSWLMAAGLKALSAEVGPDAVVFPNLRGQPLFDLHWRKELWGEVSIGGQKSVWDSLDWKDRDLLTPNLPNVFLAVVPADRAADLGARVEAAIQQEWKQIAEASWKMCEGAGLTKDENGITHAARKSRFDTQIARFFSITWQATPWPGTLEAALELAKGFDREMPIQNARRHVQTVVDMATRQTPMAHRDGRCFVGGKDGPKTHLNNVGLGWSVILALNSWALDAVRQTRDFTAAHTGGWQTGTFCNKDVLNGRDEAVAGGDEWSRRADTAGSFWPALFKKGDWLSAGTLVKRVWHRAYLEEEWKLRTDGKSFPMPNTRGIAAHDAFASDQSLNDEEDSGDVEGLPSSEKYFAVLALDGDEIGKWVSGEKTPQFQAQLADYQDGSNAQQFGSKPYFQAPHFGDFLKTRRPLSPSYHLQFSEALSNFALLCAQPIVEAFDGRLIYAGGDDVMALVPADTALLCAEALRLGFTGSNDLGAFLEIHGTRLAALNQKGDREAPRAQKLAAAGRLLSVATTIRDKGQTFHPGFLVRLDDQDQPKDQRRYSDGRNHPIPFLVPGPAADCSVGIAIAHFKSPLQDVVRAAQAAEKRAKRSPENGGLDRRAVAVTLMKRSGEIIEWGAKWDGGLELYTCLAAALAAGHLSGKFPHRFTELLEPYLTASTPLLRDRKTFQPVPDFPIDEIVRREFEHALSRQRGPGFPQEKSEAETLLGRFREALQTYLDSLTAARVEGTERRVQSLIGLCQTVAFAHRTVID